MSLVYHYTSPEALVSILQSKTLRFTDSEFCNDPAEMTFLYSLLEEEIKSGGYSMLQGGVDLVEGNPHQESWMSSLQMTAVVDVRSYFICFSKDGDSLPLWAAFCHNAGGYGYALGIDVDILMNELSKWRNSSHYSCSFEVLCHDVKYDRVEQLSSIRQILKDVNERLGTISLSVEEERERCQLEDDCIEEALTNLRLMKMFAKREDFKYEKELRVAIKMSDELSYEINAWGGRIGDGYSSGEEFPFRRGFRIGAKGVVVPYLEWDFSSCASQFIREVKLSPLMKNNKLATTGVERLLRCNNFKNVKVDDSNVLLRF